MKVDLRLGDCLGPGGMPSLPGRSIDVTITDPPFDPRTHKGVASGRVPFHALSVYEIRATARELARLTKRWIVVFAAERTAEFWAEALEVAGARFIRMGVAIRSNPMPQMSGDRPAPAVDQIVIAHAAVRGRMHWNGGGKAARWPSPPARFDNPDRKLIHAAQKPLALIEGLVSDFSDAGEMVLDPFAGSATAAIACARLRRGFLGWEIDPTFHRTAVERVATVDPSSEPWPAPGCGLSPRSDLEEVDR